jgi:hypothetical protein
MKSHVIYATRGDGSQVHGIVHEALLVATFEAIHKTGLATRITVSGHDGQAYVDSSPKLPMEQAMAWRQPDDALTAILKGRVAAHGR